MDKLDLIKELNKPTLKKDEFELALEKSGFDLPPEEDAMDDVEDLDGEEMDDLDSEEEKEYTSDTGLEDDEIQEIVDWCEEECADLSDDELSDTLRDELDELDIEPEQLDATVDRVMSMLGRGSDEEDMDDVEMDDEMGGEEDMADEFPPEEEEEDWREIGDPDDDEFPPLRAGDFMDEPENPRANFPGDDLGIEIDPDADFEDNPKYPMDASMDDVEISLNDLRSAEEERQLARRKNFREFIEDDNDKS